MENGIAQNEFNIAITEVLYIIKHFFSTYSKSKVSDKFINFLEENSIPDYEPNFKDKKSIEELELKDETKTLLALVYKDYLCTEEEKKEYSKILVSNGEEQQKILREKYNPDNLFKKEKEEQKKVVNTLPIEVKKDSIFKRIIEYIKKFFK